MSRKQGAKPIRLIVGRRDREVQRVAGFVPHAAVVGGDDTEAVLAGREIVVKNVAALSASLPVAVIAFQLVFESVLLRRDETQGSVFDLKVARECRQAERFETGLRSAMICSMWTGGGSLLTARWRGSMTLTPPFRTNHNLPSDDFATTEL